MPKYADVTFQNNILSLSGELDFANVMSVYEKSLSYFKQAAELTIDFSRLSQSNSAGLALAVSQMINLS
jgi:ABC-type transporter Mla MlaB component